MRHLLVCFIVLTFCVEVCGQNSLAAAEQLTAEEKYQASSDLLEAYIAEHPARRYDAGRAWWLISYNYLQNQQLDSARNANAKSAALRRELRSGELAENYLRTAEIELAANQPVLALIAAKQGLEMMIEDTELYLRLHVVAAQAYAARGQYEQVDKYLETVVGILDIELTPTSPAAIDTYYTAAQLELTQGNIIAARSWYLRALRYDTDLDRIHQLFEQVYHLVTDKK